jgi:flagellin
MLGINTNLMSLNAQRQLNGTNNSIAQAMERLSSGLRINSAKDDAAGLAISERFTTQIRGLNQAVRNANDGISFAQTAEGSLSTMGDALQRIRELAVQAVNDTNSPSDRAALNNEVSQLIAEFNRVASTTQFNGQNILDGSLSDLTFQVGANQNQTISVDGVDARGSKVGADLHTGDYTTSATLTGSTDLTINGVDINLAAVNTSGDVDDLITAINAVGNDSGVQAQKASSLDVSFAFTSPAADETLTINGVAINLAAADDLDAAIAKINVVSGQTGVTASEDPDSAGNILLSSANAADMTVASTAALGAIDDVYQAGVILSAEVGSDPDPDGSIIIQGTDITVFGFVEDGSQSQRNILNDVNVLTGEDATSALLTVDFALQQINGLRSELGAVQVRFESTIANLSIASENLTAARSRIQDADFAAETANLTRGQILQQAGIAMLAQANAQPQTVLALLQ